MYTLNPNMFKWTLVANAEKLKHVLEGILKYGSDIDKQMQIG